MAVCVCLRVFVVLLISITSLNLLLNKKLPTVCTLIPKVFSHESFGLSHWFVSYYCPTVTITIRHILNSHLFLKFENNPAHVLYYNRRALEHHVLNNFKC